jgi:hypothetical protein
MSPAETKAIVDKFAAADSSMTGIAAIAKQLIDRVAADAQALSAADRYELDARRKKERIDRDKDNAYRRDKRRKKAASGGRPSDEKTSVGRPTDALSSRARSSSILEEESKKEGGGGNARARAIDENSSAEQIADAVERIVKETGHWPKGGWVRSSTITQLERRIRIGQSPLLILDAVERACKRDTSGQPFHSLTYFDAPIARAHSEANKEPTLPLDETGAKHGSPQHSAQREAQQFGRDIVEQLRRSDVSGRG